MPTPPPLPPENPPTKSSPLRLAFTLLLALVCVGAALYIAWTNLYPAVIQTTGESHSQRDTVPLREIDVAKLVDQYSDKQDYFRKLESATLEQYDKLNDANDPWFSEGREAAKLFAAFAVWNDFYAQGILQTADAFALAAYKKGCRDPLISTICDIDNFDSRHSNSNSGVQQHIQRTLRLSESDYAPLFKLMASGILIKNLSYGKTYPDQLHDDLSPSWSQLPEITAAAGEQFADLLAENPPADLLFFRTQGLLDNVEDGESLEPIGTLIDQTFAREAPDHPARAAIRGEFLVDWAWQARGSGWANTVSQDGWRLMADRLEQARTVLTKAYEENPDDYLAATVMLTVELGQGKGISEMEKWFDRAMKNHPDNFSACKSKGWYLQPRWHGSPQDAVAFGIECAETGNWKAKLPLILTIGIENLADQNEDPYLNDEVWSLVSPVYEGFLEQYPDSIGVRTTYANCAARGRRAEVLREQLAVLGPDWDRSVWSLRDFQRISGLAAKN